MRGTRFGRMAVLGLAVGTALLGGAAPDAAAQKTEAALASPNNPEIILVRAMTLFVTKVSEKTKGNVVIKVVHSGQLGGMKENFESIMAGNLEMAQVNNAFLANLYPATALFDLPFLFRDNEHMKKVVRGPNGQQV
jgi:TRAP-type C4-dicarboxylate transport system substrate-binding protein